MWKIFILEGKITPFHLIQQASTEYWLVLIHNAWARINKYESYESCPCENFKDWIGEKQKMEWSWAREPFSSERTIWKTKWGQETAVFLELQMI